MITSDEYQTLRIESFPYEARAKNVKLGFYAIIYRHSVHKCRAAMVTNSILLDFGNDIVWKNTVGPHKQPTASSSHFK